MTASSFSLASLALICGPVLTTPNETPTTFSSATVSKPSSKSRVHLPFLTFSFPHMYSVVFLLASRSSGILSLFRVVLHSLILKVHCTFSPKLQEFGRHGRLFYKRSPKKKTPKKHELARKCRLWITFNSTAAQTCITNNKCSYKHREGALLASPDICSSEDSFRVSVHPFSSLS